MAYLIISQMSCALPAESAALYISIGGYQVNIVILLGPPAAGKTTLARNTLRAGTLGKTAYILNDDATKEEGHVSQMFDAITELPGLTELKTMGEGCFGCSDDATLIRELQQLSKARAYDTILLEPFGFISGDELPDLLLRNGFTSNIITLLDVQNIQHNKAWGIVPGQLRRATAGIGLTKSAGTETDDPNLEAYLAEHSSGTPTFRLGIDDPLPDWVIAQFGSTSVDPKESHHGHHHHHHHDHSHPDLKYSFLLRDYLSADDLERIFSESRAQGAALRVKGVLHGRQFQGQIFPDNVPAASASDLFVWSDDPVGNVRNMVTFYASRPISIDFMSGLVLDEYYRLARSTKELLRSTSHCTTAESIAFLREWMDKCPRTIAYGLKGPIVYTEATEAVNELRKRPDVMAAAADLVAEAICLRVDHAIRIVQDNPPGSRWYDDKSTSEWKRDCAITIAWFALHRPEALGDTRINLIRSLELDDLLAAGLSQIERFNSNPEKAAVFAEEAGDVARFLGHVSTRLTEQYERMFRLAIAWDAEHGSNTAALWRDAMI